MCPCSPGYMCLGISLALGKPQPTVSKILPGQHSVKWRLKGGKDKNGILWIVSVTSGRSKITCLFHESMKFSKPHSILIRQPIRNIYCQFSLQHDSFPNNGLFLPPAVLNYIMSEANLKEASAPPGSEKGYLEPDCWVQGQLHHWLPLEKSCKLAGPQFSHL